MEIHHLWLLQSHQSDGLVILSVLTDVGDAAFIIGYTGYVVPIKDPNAMSKKIIEMLYEKENNILAWENRKSKCNERIVKNFSIEKMIQNYQMVWNNL
jgi:glycosyltransferase involved in cell wall biosynthesis